MVIYMTEDLTSDKWNSFELIFLIDITNPTNYQGSTTLSYSFKEVYSNILIAAGKDLPLQFTVSRPLGTGETQVTTAWGVDVSLQEEIDLGVGIYSNTFCNSGIGIIGTDGTSPFISHCDLPAFDASSFSASTDTAVVESLSNCANYDATTLGTGKQLHVPNAIEMQWKVPYNIPNDKTEITIDCAADN